MNLADVDLETLELKDIIVLHFSTPPTQTHGEIAGIIGTQLNQLVIVLGPGDSIEALDTDQMRAHGWHRADAKYG